jgi:hypothetical protein
MRKHLDYKVISELAKQIANRDFRVTVTQHVADNVSDKHWIITVGETTWQRHLVVSDFEERDNNPLIDVLKPVQSGRMITDVNPHDIDFVLLDFKGFLASGYLGIKETLTTTVQKAA